MPHIATIDGRILRTPDPGRQPFRHFLIPRNLFRQKASNYASRTKVGPETNRSEYPPKDFSSIHPSEAKTTPHTGEPRTGARRNAFWTQRFHAPIQAALLCQSRDRKIAGKRLQPPGQCATID